MRERIYKITNKLPGLSYCFTLSGVELPVLDITHPDFVSSTDEKVLARLLPYVEKNAEENAEKFKKIPAFIKRYWARNSFAMNELLQMEGESAFASGITTLMMKLGPRLIGKGKKRFWDRQMTKGFGSLAIRIRARDISRLQAEALTPLLERNPGRDISFFNIAGGAACDNINALILIIENSPSLLQNRRIEINDLDIDDFGPAFAERSINALKAQGGRFSGLDITFRRIKYDWTNPGSMTGLLAERKDWLQICTSEGGLFEYCSDDLIIQTLDVLHSNTIDNLLVAGTIIRDIETVDKGMVAALKISSGIKPSFLGINGLKKILDPGKWRLEKIMENNPRYLVFYLTKQP